MTDYVAIATWPFGRIAVAAAMELLKDGKPALDAALAGAQAVEDDPKVQSVGYGSIPNAVGTLELDACVMDGKTLSCGAVAGLENIRHAAAVARRVMEKTPHVLLVGEGAKQFALQEGFPLENLNTPEGLTAWETHRKPKGTAVVADNLFTHDTVTVLALDQHGNLGGVCTTSGLAYKLPGRVGDSPIIGAGLYVDNSAGAAGGTGAGEEILRICGSTIIIEALRAGKSPQEACEIAVRKANAVALRRGVHPAQVAFIALDPRGRTGAASTAAHPFDYAVARNGKVEMHTAPMIKPEGAV